MTAGDVVVGEEDDERRLLDLEWRAAMRTNLDTIKHELRSHIDSEEVKLDTVLKIVRALEDNTPPGHLKQHDALQEWIEERKWFAELRRDAIKKGLLWVLAALAIFALSRVFPGLEGLLHKF